MIHWLKTSWRVIASWCSFIEFDAHVFWVCVYRSVCVSVSVSVSVCVCVYQWRHTWVFSLCISVCFVLVLAGARVSHATGTCGAVLVLPAWGRPMPPRVHLVRAGRKHMEKSSIETWVLLSDRSVFRLCWRQFWGDSACSSARQAWTMIIMVHACLDELHAEKFSVYYPPQKKKTTTTTGVGLSNFTHGWSIPQITFPPSTFPPRLSDSRNNLGVLITPTSQDERG